MSTYSVILSSDRLSSARKKFLKDVEALEKLHKRKPKRKGSVSAKDLRARRDKRMSIWEAAKKRLAIEIRYTKTTTNITKTYVVNPYEWAYRRSAKGVRLKVLWAYDVKDRHIKSFYLSNIQTVKLTNKHFKPKWPVKIF